VVVTNIERDPMTVIRVENMTDIIIGITIEVIMMTGGAIIIEHLKKITNGAVEEIITMTTTVKTIIKIPETTSILLEMTVTNHTKDDSTIL